MVGFLGQVTARNFFVLMLAVLTVSSFLGSNPASALRVGDWEGICMAPNHLTGEIEQVKKREVSVRPFHPWFARTSRMPDGTWKTEFNVFVILASKLSNDTKKFIFYHECAHARLNEASERMADCAGLAHMKNEMIVTDQAIKDISHAYLLILRTFPTGGPCDGTATKGEQTANSD